jgi:SAM-dependent methyltransferase
MAEPSKSEARAVDGQFWSDLGMKYEEAYGQDDALVMVVQKWLSLLPPAASVLECGCGTGKPIARTIADGGYRYHGIDLASGMVALCQRQVPEGSYEVVNMLDYVPKIEYDGAVASLSHFELSPQEHVEMARKWFEWLRPGGFMLLSTIDGEDWYGAKSFDPETGSASGMENVFLGNKIIITMFTQKGWRKLLEDAGFDVVYIETDLFKPKAKDAPEEPRYYIIAKKPATA